MTQFGALRLPSLAALGSLLVACGTVPAETTQLDLIQERDRLVAEHPDADGFAFLDSLNSGLVLNFDGTGTYVRNAGIPDAPHVRSSISIVSFTPDEVCFSNGCLSLSATAAGDRVCDVQWANGNEWRWLCILQPIPSGFDIETLERPGL